MEKPLISFDYAIKYLLKNKGDYDIIEGFISALFAAQGYPPVKINALLDGESNKEELELKRSIADLVVEDAEGNKYQTREELMQVDNPSSARARTSTPRRGKGTPKTSADQDSQEEEDCADQHSCSR